MALIDVVKAHYENLGTRSLRVPEWENVEIYVSPLTLGEKNLLWRVQTDPDRSQFDLFAETIVLKARDEKGNRLFSDKDKLGLLNAADPTVVERVATEIVKHTEVDVAKK